MQGADGPGIGVLQWAAQSDYPPRALQRGDGGAEYSEGIVIAGGTVLGNIVFRHEDREKAHIVKAQLIAQKLRVLCGGAGAVSAGQHKIGPPVAGEIALPEKILHHMGHAPAVGGADKHKGTVRMKVPPGRGVLSGPGAENVVYADQLIPGLGLDERRGVAAVAGAGKVKDHSAASQNNFN